MALLANQIWQCLDLELLDGSEILAEQLVANDDSSDTRYLLAYVQYRRQRFETAKLTCKSHMNHAGCVWVYAQSCLKLEQGGDGLKALEHARGSWDFGNDMPLPINLGRGELSPAAFHLLFAKLQALTDPESAITEYTTSARLNPYLLENVMALCASAKVKVKTTALFTRFEDPFAENLAGTVDVKHHTYPLHHHTGSNTNTTGTNNTGAHAVGTGTISGMGTAPFTTTTGSSSAHVPTNFYKQHLHTHHGIDDAPPSFAPPQTITSTPRRLETPRRTLSTPMGPKPPLHPANIQGPLGSVFGPSPSFVHNEGSVAGNTFNFHHRASGHHGGGLGGLFQTPVQNSTGEANGNFNAGAGAGARRQHQDRMLSWSFKRSDQPSLSSLGRGIFTSPQHNTTLPDAKTGVEAMEALAEALELLSEAEFTDALAQISSLAEPIRKTPFVLELVGRLHLEAGKYAESVKTFEELRALQPDRTNGMELMSTALWHLKRDLPLSMLGYELTRKGTKLRKHWQSWCVLGNAFSLRHDTQNAIKCFKRATSLNPKSEYAFTLMGYEYVAHDELENASYAFSQALQVNSQHYNAWYGLGSVHYSLGQYTSAEMHFTQAIRLNPNNPILLCFLGAVLEASGKYPQALAQFEKACQLNPSSPMPRFRKAEALLEAGMFREALKELLEIETVAPEDPTIHFAIAKAHRGLGEGELAVQRFTSAQQLAPKMAVVIRKELDAM